jgi:3-oxocholest-4-en-26-oyl-CoA dehydrogenase beta subunit
MDFNLTADQEALRTLVRQILTDHVTEDRLKQLRAAEQWWDRDAWKALAQSSVFGVAVPEALGGSGLGLIEIGIVCEELGRAVAPVPLLAAVVLGALPLAAFGSPAQQAEWLPGVAAGTTILTAALLELGGNEPWEPQTTARRDGNGWRLDGVKVCVPAADVAARILVPARTPDGVAVFLVDPKAADVTVAAQVLTNGEPHGRLALVGAAAELLVDAVRGEDAVQWMTARATIAYCALQVGVCEAALRMTAAYTTERKQFDRAIATFQAVQQRAADAFIDLDCIRTSTWEALYLLAEGASGADALTAVRYAKFWASEAGQRVVVAAQHLHGGIGVDIDYPLHRYFWWAKYVELLFGPGTEQLAKLGATLAAS